MIKRKIIPVAEERLEESVEKQINEKIKIHVEKIEDKQENIEKKIEKEADEIAKKLEQKTSDVEKKLETDETSTNNDGNQR